MRSGLVGPNASRVRSEEQVWQRTIVLAEIGFPDLLSDMVVKELGMTGTFECGGCAESQGPRRQDERDCREHGIIRPGDPAKSQGNGS